jgi:multicomponent Na+:H+ antiporter subunit C
MMSWLGHYNYWIYAILMMIGFYAVIARPNLVKKVIGLGLFQTAAFLFYISIGMLDGGTAPIEWAGAGRYVNPLPHVLILTAIVVSVSTMAVALALVIAIHRSQGSIETRELDGQSRTRSE